jgi:enediyne biosynthesis protein E4
MSKQKTTKPAQPAPVSTTKSRSKWYMLALVFLIVGGGYYWWQKKGGSSTATTELHTAADPQIADKPLLALMPASETGIDFQNMIVETEQSNILNNINAYNGGGVAVADINNDQLPDIYFVCSNGKNRMYLNQGNFRFKDITDQSGLASEAGFETAVTAADVNGDGYLDFYVCRGGPIEDNTRRNCLYINNGASAGGLTFTEKSNEFGLDDISASTGAAFLDSDLDGDLDLYLLNYPTDLSFASKLDVRPGPNGQPTPNLTPKKPYDSDRFYRNDGGKFVDISQAAGVWNFAYGLSVSVTDVNRDGYPDIYVGNDFIQPDRLYINNRKGGFEDHLADYFKHCGLFTMGTELADFDNDALVDLFSVDMLPDNTYRQKAQQNTNSQSKYFSMVQNGYFEVVSRNVLHRNNGNGSFIDVACLAGVFQTDWSWSGLLADLNNDGHKDLHITNGYRREISNRDFMDFSLTGLMKTQGQSKSAMMKNILENIPTYRPNNHIFENTREWGFAERSGEWMTMEPAWSCGAAWADFDADGDLDLVVNNLESPAFVYKNLCRDQNKGNYLQFKLEGDAPNAFAVGASVLIRTPNGTQYQEVQPNHGIFSSVQHLVHFGLGNLTQADQVQVRWPNGKTQTLQGVAANQRLVLKQSDASGNIAHLATFSSGNTLFRPFEGIQFTHRDNAYTDYEHFPLNLWKETDHGPLIAVGDANGDGLDDCFIGNGFDAAASLLLQNASGNFSSGPAAAWEADKRYEDHGAVFFDSDGDGDQDLFVVSGGAEATNPIAWQSRLYENTDGKGNYKIAAKQPIPALADVGLRVIALDFDADGDQDLIIGGRVQSGKWPLPPATRILRNEKSHFMDATDAVGAALKNCGMVTDLAWADLNGDKKPELIVCGEWMPIQVYAFNDGKFVEESSKYGFDKSNGFWNRLALSDLDNDGDMDIVSGNLGLNTRFSASPEAPLHCFAKDFDKNNTLDPLIAVDDHGKLRPWPQKEVIHRHIPALKKNFLHAHDYALAEVYDLFPRSDFDQALHLQVYVLEHSWWENQGGKFVRHALPRQAQVAPAFGLLVDDFNRDGQKDILLAGNKYGVEVELGRFDAGMGTLLLGDGKGGFAWMDNPQSGFLADKEVRDMACLRGAGGRKTILVTNNNGKAQAWAQ